ncbi:unnamed protein product [Lymnaea stagnalis]|uniref:Uncharacterized protein n=1 Tax=Lymnaea stagnalis TaxID=6523 RepID=A0AAV2H6N2_LYMST
MATGSDMINSDSKFSLCKFLNERIIEVNKNRDVLERECSIIRSLLKPWPKKKEKKTEMESEFNLKENIGNSELVKRTADLLSTEEKQALQQVDVLLRKAQNTRQLKANDSIKHGANVNVQTASNLEKLSVVATHEVSTPSNEHLQVTNAKIEKKSTKQNSLKNSRCSSAVENTSCSLGSVSGTTDSKKKLQTPTISVDKRKASDRGISRLISTQKLSRSFSATGRPGINSSHYVPAHKLAPFKTHENTGTSMSVSKYNKKKPHTAKLASLNSSKSKTVNGHKTLPGISLENVKEEITKHQNKNNSKTNLDSVSADSSNDQYITRADLPAHTLLVNDRISSTPPPEPIITNAEGLKGVTNFQADENFSSDLSSNAKTFTLQANGRNLKLPAKLIQLVEKNQTLRNRCSAAKMIKQVRENDPAQQYIEKLESQYEVGQELWTRVSALTCLKSHQILWDTLESLHLEEISESAPTDVILRAKRILEFILSTFARLQKEAVYFSKAQFTNPSLMGLMPKGDHVPDQLWLDAEQNIKGQSYLQYYLNSHKRWTQMNFTEKYLKLQISIAELVQSEWWDFLKSGCQEPSVLQSVYGLMTTSGCVLPAFVKNLDSFDY